MDKEHIRPIVICLFRRGRRILVCEAYDSAKGDYFCRPIGGGVAFGEHSRESMLREIREEIGAEVENVELVGVLESSFRYEGEQGHEVVFVYDAEFRDKRMFDMSEIQGYESEIDARFVARWQSLEELQEKDIRLVPEGLSDMISGLSE
jgi:ADP-ribose pyrophosphatase YjhB (NUDIX family)